MMQFFRSKSNTWYVRGFFLFLALCFVFLWGIGDMINSRGSSLGDVAKVGGKSISAQAYHQALTRQIDQIQKASGQKIDPKMIRAIGLDQMILAQLIRQALIDQEVKRLDLEISDETVRLMLQKDKTFFDEKGQFSPKKFQDLLQANHMKEATFVVSLKEDMKRAQFMDAFRYLGEAPSSIVEQMYGFVYQTRAVEYVTLRPDASKITQVPDEKELKSFYDKNSSKFKTPETRDVTLVLVEKKGMTSEAAYELTQKLEDSLGSGKSLEEVQKELNLKILSLKGIGGKSFSDVTFTKDSLSKITQVAMDATEGAESSLEELPNGDAFVLRVDRITPEGTLKYQDARTQGIELWKQAQAEELAKKSAEALVTHLSKGVGGLKEKAFSLGYATQSIPALKRQVGKGEQTFFSDAASAKLFAQPLKTPVFVKENGSFVVAVAMSQANPDFKSIKAEDQKAFKSKIADSLGNDTLDTYLSSLETKYPVSIHQKGIDGILKFMEGSKGSEE